MSDLGKTSQEWDRSRITPQNYKDREAARLKQLSMSLELVTSMLGQIISSLQEAQQLLLGQESLE